MKYPGKGPHPIQYLYPRKVVARRYPSRYFGENELSPGLITLSVLPTSHPLSFQPKWVRSSTQFNPRFNLPMGRSHRFRVCSIRQFALFRLGFPGASARKALTKPQTVTRRIIMQKARRHTSKQACIVLRPLVGTWFQVQSPPLAGVLPIFQSPY